MFPERDSDLSSFNSPRALARRCRQGLPEVARGERGEVGFQREDPPGEHPSLLRDHQQRTNVQGVPPITSEERQHRYAHLTALVSSRTLLPSTLLFECSNDYAASSLSVAKRGGRGNDRRRPTLCTNVRVSGASLNTLLFGAPL
eukprot:3159011-Pyramimonas_sp.AAC.3